jgi:hypothetical protein
MGRIRALRFSDKNWKALESPIKKLGVCWPPLILKRAAKTVRKRLFSDHEPAYVPNLSGFVRHAARDMG